MAAVRNECNVLCSIRV